MCRGFAINWFAVSESIAFVGGVNGAPGTQSDSGRDGFHLQQGLWSVVLSWLFCYLKGEDQSDILWFGYQTFCGEDRLDKVVVQPSNKVR